MIFKVLTSYVLLGTSTTARASASHHHHRHPSQPCQWPSFIPLWDESTRTTPPTEELPSPRPCRQSYQQHSQRLHHRWGGGKVRVCGGRWELPMAMADDTYTTSRQQACCDSDDVSSIIYTRLDDDDDHHQDTSAMFAGQRDMQHILQVMEKAAYLAGDITRATSGRIAVQMTKANERDLVTQSDLQCQRLIRDVLSKEFPNDLFLGEEEEDGEEDDKGSETDNTITIPNDSMNSLDRISQAVGEGKEDRLLFVVDPIDGTTNFQAGLPIYAISIGAVSFCPTDTEKHGGSGGGHKLEVVAGVIYNPAMNELISAVRGRGCYLNNERIRPRIALPKHGDDDSSIRKQSVLSQSLINVGYPIKSTSTLKASSRAISALSTKVRGLRIMACASQTMAWVAQSKFDAYIGWDLNAWDVAAGLVIVQESGGQVCNFDGSRADIMSRDMIITCASRVSCSEEADANEDRTLRDELIQVLRDHDCMDY